MPKHQLFWDADNTQLPQQHPTFKLGHQVPRHVHRRGARHAELGVLVKHQV